MSKVKGLKLTVRLLILAAAFFFTIGGPLPAWMERAVPALSPLTVLAESIAQRTWYLSIFWLLPPLAVLLSAMLKGRLFCQWICPLGTMYSLPKKLSRRKKILPVRLNATVFWTILFSSVFGLPVLLHLDPLSTFSRAGALEQTAAWVPGLIIPVFLLLSFFQTQVWCTHLCPLGYFFDLTNLRTSAKVFRRDRRQFLAGLGIGGTTAALLPRIGQASENKKPAVLPPGSTEQFTDICTRCYACVNACPVGIIKVKKDGSLREMAIPELVFEEYGCEESCNICSQICPTGAIRNLPYEHKKRTQIGIAKIEKNKCLAWEDKEYCMVCDEYCPYNAIETEWVGDVACPVVSETICRGCGACEGACPAIREGKAIFVHGAKPQKLLEDQSPSPNRQKTAAEP